MAYRALAILTLCTLTLGCRGDSEVVIDLAAPIWSVEGVVVDSGGKPIAGTYLELRRSDRPGTRDFLMARIAAGPDGRFYFATPIGGEFAIDVVGLSPCAKTVPLGMMKDQDRTIRIVVTSKDCMVIF